MSVYLKLVLEPGLAQYAEWTLSFVQEMGVSTDLERGWSTQQNLFLSFLIYEAKTGPTSTLCFFVTQISFFAFLIGLAFKQGLIFRYNFFSIQFSTVNVSSYKTCFGTRTGSIWWMDLELCTGDGCKYWPRKGLVHPAKSLPELLDLRSRLVLL